MMTDAWPLNPVAPSDDFSIGPLDARQQFNATSPERRLAAAAALVTLAVTVPVFFVLVLTLPRPESFAVASPPATAHGATVPDLAHAPTVEVVGPAVAVGVAANAPTEAPSAACVPTPRAAITSSFVPPPAAAHGKHHPKKAQPKTDLEGGLSPKADAKDVRPAAPPPSPPPEDDDADVDLKRPSF
jgi:hypothetical protein